MQLLDGFAPVCDSFVGHGCAPFLACRARVAAHLLLCWTWGLPRSRSRSWTGQGPQRSGRISCRHSGRAEAAWQRVQSRLADAPRSVPVVMRPAGDRRSSTSSAASRVGKWGRHADGRSSLPPATFEVVSSSCRPRRHPLFASSACEASLFATKSCTMLAVGLGHVAALEGLSC